jgi:YidC/Oxa1 family membrane protein insertase
MDKKEIGIVVLLVVLLMTYPTLFQLFWPEKPHPHTARSTLSQSNQVARTQGAGSSTSPSSATSAPSLPVGSDILGNAKTNSNVEAKLITLENDQTRVDFTSVGGGIQNVLLKQFPEGNDFVRLNQNSPFPVLDSEINKSSFLQPYELKTIAPNKVEASTRSPDGIEITKEYTLGTNYQIEAKITIHNTSKDLISAVPLRVTLGMASPLNSQDAGQFTGLTFFSNNKAIADTLAGVQKQVDKQGKIYQKEQPIEWAAIKDQYFTTLITPAVSFSALQAQPFALPLPKDFSGKYPPRGLLATISSSPIDLAPDSTTSFVFSIYAGPTEHRILATLGKQQDQVLGLWTISTALLWLLTAVHGVVHNWGYAILGVTLLLRILFWPLTTMSTKSAKQMQSLAPMINAIKEKHKDNQQKIQEETMKLYQEYKINPIAGCLPMIPQMFVLAGFYSMLRSAVELRGAPFIYWVHDLSMPDTVGHIPGLNFPINPLPLLMVATMIWQTRITPQPPNADPSMQMMMWFMPAVFLYFSYTYSSALSLYIMAQNLLTIAQTYYNKDKPIPPLVKVKRKGGLTFSRRTK